MTHVGPADELKGVRPARDLPAVSVRWRPSVAAAKPLSSIARRAAQQFSVFACDA